MPSPARDNTVFLNCPFDEEYQEIFDAIIFTVTAAGYQLRCAMEADDAGGQRLTKIAALIGKSKFAIHDLSRTGIDTNTGLPRFNMPLELGISLGAKLLGTKKHRDHYLLVMQEIPYAHQKAVSDIAGTDPKSHNGAPKTAIRLVRDFLSTNIEGRRLPLAVRYIKAFEQFENWLDAAMKAESEDRRRLTFQDRLALIEEFSSLGVPPSS